VVNVKGLLHTLSRSVSTAQEELDKPGRVEDGEEEEHGDEEV
jgi:hypothetical protein